MNQPPLFISEADVARLVDINDAIAALEGAFALWRAPTTINLPRQRMAIEPGIFNLMASSLGPQRVFATKAYFATPQGAVFHVALYSPAERRMLALMESELMSQLRTGAASGLATKLMAKPDSKTLGVIGTGKQARAQVLAVCAVRPIESIRVFGRSAERRDAFVRAIAEETGIETRGVDSGAAAVEGADVVALITKSAEPVVKAEWLADGVHINAAGANTAIRRELDAATVERATLLVTDDRAQAQQEAAEFRDLAAAGRLRWEDVHELGDVLTGAAPNRRSPSEVTLFKSLGIALEDVAFGEMVYRKAIEAGMGRSL
jgi:ornithine cyclodeaminase/alanine dehydrogenase